jgi:ketol-acid reductoisomerase
MASRTLSKALRSPLGRQLASPAVQRRTMVSALSMARATAVTASRVAARPAQQQVRGVKTIDFAGSKEEVYGEL